MFRTLAAAVLFVITVTLSVLGLGAAAHASTPPDALSCTAYVDVYEDGTWGGSEVRNADGTWLADRWDVTTPDARGFHVDPYGMWSYGMAFGADNPCQMRDGRELWAGSDSTLQAPCTTSIVLEEDGTWWGGEVISGGQHIASTWSVGGPDLQGTVTDDHAVTEFVPTWAGSFCSYGLT